MTLRLNPYVVLNGNAKEAITFYEKALGAKIAGEVMTFAQMPGDPSQMPPGAGDLVAHAMLMIGESILMLSDNFPGRPFQVGDQLAIMISVKSKEEGQRIFNALAEGGKVEMPFEETFWSPGYGALRDKFGINFQVNTDTTQ